MAIREIIEIDEELCDGCGDCVTACHEGAIQIVDGVAKVVNDSYCDGLGDCIGECPLGAITIIEREAIDFDEAAVEKHLATTTDNSSPLPIVGSAAEAPAVPVPSEPCGCPGSAMRSMGAAPATPVSTLEPGQPVMPSQLGHWPIQLMLVPPHAPFLKNADLLICADCVPFTVPDFHFRYMTGRAVIVGCPKLDDLQHYLDKLKAMFAEARPRRITVLKMEVPCCHGIAQIAVQARNEVVPEVPIEVHTIGIQGGIECKIPPRAV
ncbi:MAG: 4Fe-4S binding protein [candidate division Zixibacteria bacterium]|nr:4Fe-4S binding protein [candidate division Zixibacteria bacterium]